MRRTLERQDRFPNTALGAQARRKGEMFGRRIGSTLAVLNSDARPDLQSLSRVRIERRADRGPQVGHGVPVPEVQGGLARAGRSRTHSGVSRREALRTIALGAPRLASVSVHACLPSRAGAGCAGVALGNVDDV